MTNTAPDTDRSRRYLLGLCHEDEAVALEDEYFAREEVLDEVAAAEEALIEDFLDGRLVDEERVRFDSHYLASRVHARRVKLVETLIRRRARSGWRRSFVPLLAIAAVVVVGLVVGVRFLPGRVAPAPRAAAGVVTLELRAIATRAEGTTPILKLEGAVGSARLVLERAGDPSGRSLVVRLRSVEGVEAWRGAAEPDPDHAGAVVATVPASAIASGDQVVEILDGAEVTDRYYFRAVR